MRIIKLKNGRYKVKGTRGPGFVTKQEAKNQLKGLKGGR